MRRWCYRPNAKDISVCANRFLGITRPIQAIRPPDFDHL